MQSHILELRKFIDPKLCSKIISYFDNSYNDAKTTNGSNKNIRNCLTRSLFDNDTLGKSIVSNFVQSKIFEICKLYKDKFPYFAYDNISSPGHKKSTPSWMKDKLKEIKRNQPKATMNIPE